MEKYYCFAGVGCAVEVPPERMYENDGILAPFRVQSVTDPHRFIFTFPDSLSAPTGELIGLFDGFRVYGDDNTQVRYIGSVGAGWETAYLRAEHRGKDHFIQVKQASCPGRLSITTLLNSIQAEHLICQAGGFILHASCILRNGRAILFTAPSGTGKSTQAALWQSLRNARILNGDRAVVRFAEGQYVADAIPFAGSSHICENQCAPLAAVVYLSQAPETTIHRLRGAQAFRRVWEGISVNIWDKADMELASGAVMELVQQVPVYYLACTPDESAVTALENCLRR